GVPPASASGSVVGMRRSEGERIGGTLAAVVLQWGVTMLRRIFASLMLAFCIAAAPATRPVAIADLLAALPAAQRAAVEPLIDVALGSDRAASSAALRQLKSAAPPAVLAPLISHRLDHDRETISAVLNDPADTAQREQE